MRKILIYGFLFLSIVSCKTNYTASEIVYNKIKIAEKIVETNNTNLAVDDFLENLSGIECTKKVELYHQYSGIPTIEIVDKWKHWYEENKDDFYFNPNYECLDILHISKKDRKKIVFLKIKNSNEIKSSLSEDLIFSCIKLKASININSLSN